MARADEPAFVPPCEPFWADPPPHGGAPPVAPQYRLVPAGGTLYAQGGRNEAIFTVIEGWVFLHHVLEDGRRQILDFLLPGDVCGAFTLARAGAAHTAEALTEAAVAVLPRSGLPAMLAGSPGYGEALMTRMAASVQGAQDALVDAGRRSAIEAVAHLLLRLDARARAATGERDRTAIGFPPTQEHIGDALGLTAVHVCRTLRVLRERGIATLSRKRLRIDDRPRLAETAGVEPTCRVDTARAGESADPASLGEAG